MESYDTIIGANVKLQGNLANQGAIQINGTVEGQIDSESTVIIGPGAIVKGPVQGKIVEVSGEIHGSVTAQDRIELNPKAKVYGDIATRNLVIKLGAIFAGKSTLIPDTAEKAAPKPGPNHS